MFGQQVAGDDTAQAVANEGDFFLLDRWTAVLRIGGVECKKDLVRASTEPVGAGTDAGTKAAQKDGDILEAVIRVNEVGPVHFLAFLSIQPGAATIRQHPVNKHHGCVVVIRIEPTVVAYTD